MTASTSGSNTEAGTNISSAFKQAILGHPHQSPGINKRQVWGRMATQLFAKSALAKVWGGKTAWVVQDELLKNIELTTKLTPGRIMLHPSDNITFISMSYGDGKGGHDGIDFIRSYSGEAGIVFEGSGTYADILLPKSFPSKIVVTEKAEKLRPGHNNVPKSAIKFCKVLQTKEQKPCKT